MILVSEKDDNQVDGVGDKVFWMVFGWAVGKLILDPAYDKVVSLYEQVDDYFVALRRSNELEAEAKHRFYQLYPDGNIIDSGNHLFEEGREPLIPFGYESLPY